jgi:hypothetical protein
MRDMLASRGRLLALALALAPLSLGIALYACTSDPPSAGFIADEAGVDAADFPDTSAPVDAGSSKDTGVPSTDASPREGGACSPAKGVCDLVLQDCPVVDGIQGACVPRLSGGAFVAVCEKPQASQLLPLGRACCPGAKNPCLPGLICTGEACGDGGAPSGRCSPYCCPGDNSQCGASSPEGISGVCDITFTDSKGNDGFYGCTYKERCIPFGIQPCKTAGAGCRVEDKLGNASCTPVFGTPAKEYEACNLKQCGDGMMCFAKTDGGSACRYLCRTPNSVVPFDAGLLGTTAGRGGCPAGETCSGPVSPDDFPAWISICQ